MTRRKNLPLPVTLHDLMTENGGNGTKDGREWVTAAATMRYNTLRSWKCRPA